LEYNIINLSLLVYYLQEERFAHFTTLHPKYQWVAFQMSALCLQLLNWIP